MRQEVDLADGQSPSLFDQQDHTSLVILQVEALAEVQLALGMRVVELLLVPRSPSAKLQLLLPELAATWDQSTSV